MSKRACVVEDFEAMLPSYVPCTENETIKRCTNKSMNLRQLESTVHEVANDLNIPLEYPLTTVVRMPDGTIRITATAKEFPKSDEDRTMMESALHASLSDWISQMVERSTVHIHIPPVQNSPIVLTKAHHSITPSVWIKQQVQTVNDWALQCSKTIAAASLTRVVETYPWRNKDAMILMIPALVVRAVDNMYKGLPEPLMAGNCDIILPPVTQFLLPFDLDFCTKDVHSFMGRETTTLLEFYEAVFAIVQQNRTKTTATLTLYHHLFV